MPAVDGATEKGKRERSVDAASESEESGGDEDLSVSVLNSSPVAGVQDEDDDRDAQERAHAEKGSES